MSARETKLYQPRPQTAVEDHRIAWHPKHATFLPYEICHRGIPKHTLGGGVSSFCSLARVVPFYALKTL